MTPGDPLIESDASEREKPRQRYVLDDRGFDEVPKKYRRFYRRWDGADDALAPGGRRRRGESGAREGMPARRRHRRVDGRRHRG